MSGKAREFDGDYTVVISNRAYVNDDAPQY